MNLANTAYRGWRTLLASLVPNWMTRRPGKETGYRYLWSMVLPVDVLMEQTFQGLADWAPGGPNATPTALDLIGQSRGLIQGEDETADHFAARLRNWRTNGLATPPPAVPAVWSLRGQTELLAQQLQEFLAGRPTVRVIQRIWSAPGTAPTALYVTANPDGTTTAVVAAWDWDSVSGGYDATEVFDGARARSFWGDCWVVVTPCGYPVTGSTLADLAPIWGRRDIGLGMAIPLSSRNALLQILADWKGVAFCRGIIFAYDSTLLDPSTPATAGNPTGSWGRWSQEVGGAEVPARNLGCRYVIPPLG